MKHHDEEIERLRKAHGGSINYSSNLQRMIQRHCRGDRIDAPLYDTSPFLAGLLNDDLLRVADVNTDTNDKSKETVDWPDGFIAEILALLDRIEIKDDAELASQRHDIAEKYGMTVVLGVQTSRFDN